MLCYTDTTDTDEQSAEREMPEGDPVGGEDGAERAVLQIDLVTVNSVHNGKCCRQTWW